MKLIKKILQSFNYKINIVKGRFISPFKKFPKILSLEETLNEIIYKNKSLCRFGDGEFNVIFGGNIGFQKKDEKLAFALKYILEHPVPNCMIGLPGVFGNIDMYRSVPKKFWYAYRGKYANKIFLLLQMDNVYADTNVTRFQTGFNNSIDKKKIIKLYKEIWNNRNIVFVEGEKTRMGVGNDLFDNAKSINRILVPAENAFDRLNEIKHSITTNVSKDKLLIFACGPTATVLSYDMCKEGYQTLDLGHLDIQYEYYKCGITTKKAIPGKYTNEANQRNVGECQDQKYLNSIINHIL